MKHIRWKLQKSFKMSTIISYSRKFEREENNFDNWKKKETKGSLMKGKRGKEKKAKNDGNNQTNRPNN